MRVIHVIEAGAMSLTFLGCTSGLAGTWDLDSAERDGADFTDSYLTEYGYYYSCPDAASAGLTLFDWNAGFRWRVTGGCYRGEPETYARYVFVDRRLGGFQLTPYALDVDGDVTDCRRSGDELECIDPGNGRPITLRYRAREGS